MEFLKAFLVGGLLCAAGQILLDKTKLTPARILVLYVVAGVLLGALGVYETLVDFAGAGATARRPACGSTRAGAAGGGGTGGGVGGFFPGGSRPPPGGVTAAMIFGVLAALLFKPKDKS